MGLAASAPRLDVEATSSNGGVTLCCRRQLAMILRRKIAGVQEIP
jgi:hypothetical protein